MCSDTLPTASGRTSPKGKSAGGFGDARVDVLQVVSARSSRHLTALGQVHKPILFTIVYPNNTHGIIRVRTSLHTSHTPVAPLRVAPAPATPSRPTPTTPLRLDQPHSLADTHTHTHTHTHTLSHTVTQYASSVATSHASSYLAHWTGVAPLTSA
jgi:hypothetical protein